ncbi:hypothetical protein CNEO3_510024 [Clostridium neonatale]|uniref:Uncharacterized protein n=1 Tax=Clostridium neonatale TaxID=137838 RepID=A0AAD1YIA5_9CLOT|nr:hypothetical protein CNEO_1170016 [Clostridium neonatale]CAG9712857.1 hypothetical protein CNEO_500045 [Clostridium neonatale]CAI3194548.1 hypothetical protein CNEO2_120024 [Clostridium neonatale]CAI3196913.1 hypothetical protein CNEO2_140026 [Clostridium neonatale]CAI3249571.1 hypothetical protein CNEO2_90113 [Clostridium neonatale]
MPSYLKMCLSNCLFYSIKVYILRIKRGEATFLFYKLNCEKVKKIIKSYFII